MRQVTLTTELEETWNEPGITYFKISYNSVGGTEEKHTSVGSQSPSWDSNQGPPEYEGKALTTTLW